LEFFLLPIGVPAGRGYNLKLTGVTGATKRHAPADGYAGRGAVAWPCVLAGATKAEQRPLAPYYSPVAQRRAKSLAKGGGGTAGGAPSGGGALHCNCRAFPQHSLAGQVARGLAGQTGAGVQGCEASAKTLTGTVAQSLCAGYLAGFLKRRPQQLHTAIPADDKHSRRR